MTEFESLLSTIISQIESSSLCNHKIDAEFLKITIHRNKSCSTTNEQTFYTESFTHEQAFQKTLDEESLKELLLSQTGIHYKNVTITTSTENITILANKKGKMTIIRKPLKNTNEPVSNTTNTKHNKEKNYILKEGIPVPFLVQLGVMTKEGKIVHSKYNKFKQINRYLEFVDDIVDNLIAKTETPKNREQPLEIVDFGCGKSYLTFALYYYLTELKGLKTNITGLDLKEDVITTCTGLAKEFGYDRLHFATGDIATYNKDNPEAHDPDMVITLHACNTATDFALAYAIQHKAKIILSVPCCQHELNANLGKQAPDPAFNSLLKYGIIKERFSALATDVMRAELLEQNNYSVQLLEFIDVSNTPKNILIRAVRRNTIKTSCKTTDYDSLCTALGQKNILAKMLETTTATIQP